MSDQRTVIPIEAIERARARIADSANETPLVRLALDGDGPADTELWLKLEGLQPTGSFKLRGAANVVRTADPVAVRRGLVTLSAGNLAQGVAWMARQLGVPATIIVPDHAPATKLAAIERLGARVVPIPFARWWQAVEEGGMAGFEGLFIHPADDELIAGSATLALEILEQLPEPDAVLIPYGSGGLTLGVASVLRAHSPRTRVYAVESAHAAPLCAALQAGEPTTIDYRPAFVDSVGGRTVLPAIWQRVAPLIDGAFAAPLEQTAMAVRLLAERAHVIAEGAGALATAVALAGQAGNGRLVCIVSGANIDLPRLCAIFAGQIP